MNNSELKRPMDGPDTFQFCDMQLLPVADWTAWPPGTCRWEGWSAGQVGRHVKCWRREWNGGGGP